MYNKEYYLKRYCSAIENIENYEKAKADNFKGWECHHRLETHNSDGERRSVDITTSELKALDMYWNRPASELIFLTTKEYKALHSKGKQYMLGKHLPEQQKKKISKALNGKPKTEEHRKRISRARKGMHLAEETKRKLSIANKGKSNITKGTHYYNNGVKTIRAKECPPGFIPGRLRK